MSLADLLDGDDGVLVHDAERVWTRAEVRQRADEVAARLAAAGVPAGAAVAVSLPNGGDLIATLFGVWQAGAVYVPLNPRLTAHEVDGVLAAVEPAAVLTADGLRVRATERSYDADVALVQFTSGTTGRPKPVLLRHGGILPLLDNVVAKLRGGKTAATAEPPTNLIPVSLSLWAGIYQVLFALRVGAPMVVMDAFDPATFVALVAEHRVRSVVLPPAAMTMLADDDTITSLEPLRFVRSITAPLSPLQARRFRDRFGIAVLNGYGQTEIGGEIVGWSAADSRAHGEDKLGSVGRPHEGVDVRVEDATGELQVRAPTLATGYADGTDLGDRLTSDGWFRTGDVGRVDDDGFVWIDGRLSEMINRGGLKVHPGEVEEVLRLDPGVADVAVVGVADERLGEVPWAFVVPASAPAPTSVDLDALCRRHLAPYKVPARFELVDALPRNEIGKVLTRELAARVSADCDHRPALNRP